VINIPISVKVLYRRNIQYVLSPSTDRPCVVFSTVSGAISAIFLRFFSYSSNNSFVVATFAFLKKLFKIELWIFTQNTRNIAIDFLIKRAAIFIEAPFSAVLPASSRGQ